MLAYESEESKQGQVEGHLHKKSLLCVLLSDTMCLRGSCMTADNVCTGNW